MFRVLFLILIVFGLAAFSQNITNSKNETRKTGEFVRERIEIYKYELDKLL